MAVTGKTRLDSNVYVSGTLESATLIPSAGCIVDASVSSSAAIATAKMLHQHRGHVTQSGSATSITQPILVARAAGTVREFAVGSIGVCTSTATVTVDLRKNGSTILTGTITLNNANTARVAVTGTIAGGSSPTLAAGDLLEVVTVATAGGGAVATGLFAVVTVDEASV